jgi:hypothetical protein
MTQELSYKEAVLAAFEGKFIKYGTVIEKFGSRGWEYWSSQEKKWAHSNCINFGEGSIYTIVSDPSQPQSQPKRLTTLEDCNAARKISIKCPFGTGVNVYDKGDHATWAFGDYTVLDLALRHGWEITEVEGASQKEGEDGYNCAPITTKEVKAHFMSEGKGKLLDYTQQEGEA